MMDNKHLIVAIVVLVLGLALSLTNIISGARGPDLSNDQHTVRIGEREVGIVSLSEIMDPIVDNYAGERAMNPFSLQEELTSRDIGRFPLPPPPPLASPAPPMLPLVGEWEGPQP